MPLAALCHLAFLIMFDCIAPQLGDALFWDRCLASRILCSYIPTI